MNLLGELKRRNVIRVAIAYVLIAWVLLQAADFALDLIDAPNWVIQALFVLAAIGLPGVLVFSWVFEMTPEGLKREREVDRSQSIAGQTGRKLDRVIIAALALAVTYLLVDKLYLQEKGSEYLSPATSQRTASRSEEKGTLAPASRASVAVLPFVNMSADPDNEYFSDGLTETLLHMLAQLPDLQVAARTSSFAFKGQNKSIEEIADTLGVAHILEGSVQKSGDRVRVTAQLVRADDGFHVWSQNYTRPLEDIFAIQDEIAEDVADALGTSLLGMGQDEVRGVETRNVTAYDAFLKGLEEQAKFSYASLPVAEGHFKQALALDPGFTDARLALIRNYIMKENTGLMGIPEAEAAIEPLIQQVRARDPDNHVANALEWVHDLIQFGPQLSAEERRALIEELRGYLAIAPTDTFVRLRVAGTLNNFFREPEAAKELLEAGLLIDPLAADLHQQLGDILRVEGELDSARASFERSLELEPDNPNTYHDLYDLEREANDMVAALDWARRATEVDPQDHELAADIAIDLYLLDLPEEGDRWYQRVEALAPGSSVARDVAVERATARGELERARELASAMIADQVDNRQGAFASAAFNYAQLALGAGEAREAYDFLVTVRPEITDYGTLASDLQGVFMQMTSVLLMTGFESFEARRDAWTALTGRFDEMGFPWRDPDDVTTTWDLLIRGDTEGAVDQFLAGPLEQPLATNLRRVRRGFQPLMAPVYDDPRVAARLAELDREFATMRKDVQEMLMRPEWNP